jgi:AraC family transcriptional regulator
MPPERDLLHVLRDLRGRLRDDPSLQAVAARSGWSPFHLHRAFRRAIGETPKQYTLRLRLERAAARLASSDAAAFRIAAAEGFNSHEVFTRAFRRRFGCTPTQYRARALAGTTTADRGRHVVHVDAAGPCIGLFHTTITDPQRRLSMPTLSIARKTLAAQPALIVRSRVARHELSSAIGEGLGKTFPYALGAGLAIAGRPFARYVSMGPGLITVEVGMPVATPAPGAGEIEAVVLPGGPAAVAVHAGPYDQLAETYAALERWIDTNGFKIAGPPWESYVTDPADHPDQNDWRTEVCWPLA